jgi:hypothetical protein
MAKRFQIGTVRVPKGTRYTRHYECAAWYDTIEVQEDLVVPLMAEESRYHAGEVADYPGPGYHVEGVVVASNHTSYWCGVPIGQRRLDAPEDLGKVLGYTSGWYAHALAHGILTGVQWWSDCQVELLPEYRAAEVRFTNYRGEEVTTYRIHRVEG